MTHAVLPACPVHGATFLGVDVADCEACDTAYERVLALIVEAGIGGVIVTSGSLESADPVSFWIGDRGDDLTGRLEWAGDKVVDRLAYLTTGDDLYSDALFALGGELGDDNDAIYRWQEGCT